jgi:hypothetical protein
VNLFLVGEGKDAGRAADVLESLRAPFFEDGVLERLPGGACLAHPPERVGGVRYSVVDGGRFALFAGRPIRWEGEEADGRAVLDPALYLDGMPDGLDGRFAVVRSGGEVQTDALGAYPVYRCDGWVSNSPEALRRVQERAPSPLRVEALASVLGGGWSLSGDPLWAGVSRVPWSGAGLRATGTGFSAERAGRLLVAAVRALADWPGRSNVVLVTGGRDSRLILAAARASGIEMVVRTGGTPDAPDVVVGRRVAKAAGAEHGLLDPHPHGDFQAHWREMARVLAQTTGGTATLADAAGFPLAPLDGPLPLWHTGQGGEIARGYYGAADLEGLVRKFLGQRPGRPTILSARGAALVGEAIGAWAAQLGASEEDLGDHFYLHQRMARWAAPTHAAVEPIRDSTSALWSWRLLPDLLGLPPEERRREEFHRRVLAELAPDLAEVPYGDRSRSLPRKALSELRRRAAARTSRSSRNSGMSGTFAAALAEIREVVLGAEGHPAWEVLDRARVEQLLGSPPEALDEMSRQFVWRLATVFAGFLPDGPLAQ